MDRQRKATTDEIRAIQRALDARGHYAGPIDGIAGPKTRGAIRQYQEDRGDEATGILSTVELIELGIITPPPPRKPKGLTFMQATILDYILNFATSKINWAAALLVATVVGWISTKFGFEVPQDVKEWVTGLLVMGGGTLIMILRTFFNSPKVATKQPDIITKP